MNSRNMLLAAGVACALGVPSTTTSVASAESIPRVKLDYNTAGDQDALGVTLMVATAAPHSSCRGVVRLGKRRASLPLMSTGAAGGALWHWEIAAGAPAGTLRVTVTCTVDRRKIVKRIDVPVRRGAGDVEGQAASFTKVIATGTIGKDDWTPPAKGDGGSGSHAPSLYDKAQCTYWVSTKRPDLPFFRGQAGDAAEWATSAAAAGWPVDGTPKEGDVVVFQPGQWGAGSFGHVGFVSRVLATGGIVISETNFVKGAKAPTQRTIANPTGLQFIHRQSAATQRSDDAPVAAPITTNGDDSPVAGRDLTDASRDSHDTTTTDSHDTTSTDSHDTSTDSHDTTSTDSHDTSTTDSHDTTTTDSHDTTNNGPVATTTAGGDIGGANGSGGTCSSATQVVVTQSNTQIGTSGNATSDGGSATSGTVTNTSNGSPTVITLHGCQGQSCANAVATAVNQVLTQMGMSGSATAIGGDASSGAVVNLSNGATVTIVMLGCERS